MRQLADEADRIAEEHPAPVFQMPLPCARVERGEKLVLHIHPGASEGVHQGAFTGVGVADQGNRVFLAPAAHFALFADLNFNQAAAEIADP